MVKLTPELQKKFIHLLQLGMPHKYACEACNISEQIYHVWMKLGQKKKDVKYVEFFESVQRTNSEALARKLIHLEQACANGSVTAITWWLEHNHPELFKQPSDVNVTLKPDISQFITFLNSPTYKRLRDEKQKKTPLPPTQSNDVFQQPNTNQPIQRLPPPQESTLDETEEDDDTSEDDDECQQR